MDNTEAESSTKVIQGLGWSWETRGEPTPEEWATNRVRLFAWWVGWDNGHPPRRCLCYRFWLTDGSVWEMNWLAQSMSDAFVLMPVRYIIRESWRPKPGEYYNGSCRCVRTANK